MEALISGLKQYQANSVVFSNAAHGFHWNVEGPLFTQYHEFFGDIYSEVNASIDTTSEWLRSFDVRAPYTLQEVLALQNLGETETVSNSPIVMTRMLYTMNENITTGLKNLFNLATESNEEGLADFIAGRISAHQKLAWMLRSSIKQTVN